MNTTKILFAISCLLLFAVCPMAESRNRENKKTPIQPSQLINIHVDEMMADRVKLNKDILPKELETLDEAVLENMLDREALLFPAEELYNSHWDNQRVNPFTNRKVEFPDSAEIDCSDFSLPIDNAIKITSKYGPRRKRMHQGIDLKVYVGDTIRSAFDGKVRVRGYERRGYGNYLVIRHPNGLETVYGHMSRIIVNENEIVRAGDPIGLGGSTGRSTGSHLHFETRFLGQSINPAEIIDFENGIPHQGSYVFRNLKINGRRSNIYASSESQMVYHRIKSGETLGSVAKRYGTSVEALCRLNGLKRTSVLRIGQSVCISIAPGRAQVASSEQAVTQAQVTATEAQSEALTYTYTQEQQATEPVFHKIQMGDTLSGIAKRYGVTVTRLCELNRISNNTVLRIGRSLRCS